jgi:FecR protein
MNDYLWDGSGEPDPEIQLLEALLARFRSERPAPEFPEVILTPAWFRFRPWWPRLAVASALAAFLVAALILIRRPTIRPVIAGPAWQVSGVKGSPLVGAAAMRGTGLLAAGEELETDNQSQATLKISSIGEVRVDPDTRLRVIQSNARQELLALDRGTIHAMIWAPPGRFVVNTPSATAVDLGCAYTLHVDADGAGLIKVTFGWVGFRQDGRESFIPEGAVCATRPGAGPGTPYFEDAAPAFREALTAFDFGASQARATNLATVLVGARKRDALTLWHLLSRTNGPERAQVYDRLAGFIPPPAGVTRRGILAGNQRMRDAWWNSLGYGNMSWWRLWERDWPNPAK